jgi:hypothetical protein
MAKLVIVLDDSDIQAVRELIDARNSTGEGFDFHLEQIVCALCDEENCYIAQADCVDDVENCECCRCWEELSEREQVSNNG